MPRQGPPPSHFLDESQKTGREMCAERVKKLHQEQERKGQWVMDDPRDTRH